jgi:hypothetical protein
MHSLHRHVRPGPGGHDQRRRADEADARRRSAEIVARLKAGSPPEALVSTAASTISTPMRRARAMVENNIRQPGACSLGRVPSDAGLKAAVAMTPGAILDASRPAACAAAAARAIPPGGSGGTRRDAGRAADRHLQCRRGRAGHLQGPGAPDRTGAPDVRGDDHRGPRRSGTRGHPLPARRIRLSPTSSRGPRPGRPARRGLLGARHPRGAGLRLRHPHPDGRRGLCLRRGRRADQFLRGPAGRAQDAPALPDRRAAISASRPS